MKVFINRRVKFNVYFEYLNVKYTSVSFENGVKILKEKNKCSHYVILEILIKYCLLGCYARFLMHNKHLFTNTYIALKK